MERENLEFKAVICLKEKLLLQDNLRRALHNNMMMKRMMIWVEWMAKKMRKRRKMVINTIYPDIDNLDDEEDEGPDDDEF